MAVNAVYFDGTNDYLTRGGPLTGASDGSDLLVSFWIKPDSNTGTQMVFAGQTGVGVRIRSVDGKITVRLVRSIFSFEFELDTTLTVGQWNHVLIVADTNRAAGTKVSEARLNDAVCSTTSLDDNDGAFNADFTLNDWSVGAQNNGTFKFAGGLAELWVGFNQTMDISVEANYRKFIDANGEPEDLGLDGSVPTGTVPIVYLNGDAANFGANAGSGGDFGITGSLEDTAAPGAGLVVPTTGVSAAGAVGSVTPVIVYPDMTVQVAGVSASAALGSVGIDISAVNKTVAPIGLSASSAVGSVSVKRSVTVSVAGLSAPGTLGSVIAGTFSNEITANDIKLYLSGGAANADGNASLGGDKSSTEVSSIGNLFDDVLSGEVAAGDVEYRCIYLANDHPTLSLENTRLWIEAQTASPRTIIQIGLGTSVMGGSEPSVIDEDTAPIDVIFLDAPDHAPLTIGEIPAGSHQAVWIKREVLKLSSKSDKPQDYTVLRILVDKD